MKKTIFNSQDTPQPLDWFPVEEFAQVAILKSKGYSVKQLRALVRLDAINGSVDSRGEASSSLFNVENFCYFYEVRAELERAFFEQNAESPSEFDRDSVLLEYLLRKILRKPISISQLKKALG